MSLGFCPNCDEAATGRFTPDVGCGACHMPEPAAVALAAARDEVAAMSLEDVHEAISQYHESYGEQRAEAGMGAMSLGYGTDGAYAAANAVEPPSRDPFYQALTARAHAYREDHALVAVIRVAAPSDHDDLPF